MLLGELNEEDTILKFVHHYFEEGVDHFFIYDDNSTDSTLERLSCIESKYYTMYRFNDLYDPLPKTKSAQKRMFDAMYNHVGVRYQTKWLIRVADVRNVGVVQSYSCRDSEYII